MAFRFANKVHNLVNSVVVRAAHQHQMALCADAMGARASRGQQLDAYVEQLHQHSAPLLASSAEGPRPGPARPPCQVSVATCGCARCTAPLLTAIRHYAQCGTKKVDSASCTGLPAKASKPKRSAPKECRKMKQDESHCKRFKIERCEPSKMFDCTQRKYKFKECRKNPAPYPAFSEACYEAPLPSSSECKVCPWVSDRHPTFKQPRVMLPAEFERWRRTQRSQDMKGTRKLHTGVARPGTLRFGDNEEEALARERYEREVQSRPYAVRPHVWLRQQMLVDHLAEEEIAAGQPKVGMEGRVTKFAYKPLPLEQCTEPMVYLSDLVERKRVLDAERDRVERYHAALGKVQELMVEAKQRVRVTGQPVCPKRDCDTHAEPKPCPKKIKSKVCPKESLLDRTLYKKFRGGSSKAKKGKKDKKGKKSKKDKKDKKDKAGQGRKGPKTGQCGMSAEALNAMVMETQLGRRGPAAEA